MKDDEEPAGRHDSHTILEGRISVHNDISEEEAIRRIAEEGICAEYVDIANVVRERFGLLVGAGRVEEVIRAMSHPTASHRDHSLKNSDIQLTGSLPRTAAETGPRSQSQSETRSADSTLLRNEVLKFVELMGGFDEARAAVADLERSLRSLIK